VIVEMEVVVIQYTKNLPSLDESTLFLLPSTSVSSSASSSTEGSDWGNLVNKNKLTIRLIFKDFTNFEGFISSPVIPNECIILFFLPQAAVMAANETKQLVSVVRVVVDDWVVT
jgi:hypothetical protein